MRQIAESDPKVLVISPDSQDDPATIHQDAEIYRIRLQPGESIHHNLRSGRGLWLQVMRGSLTLDGEALIAGDGASSERTKATSKSAPSKPPKPCSST